MTNKPAWLRLVFTFVCVCGGLLAIAKVFADGSFRQLPGEITRIVDGDTVAFKYEDKSVHIRMMGMDAPEAHFPIPGKDGKIEKFVAQGQWGRISTEYLEKLIPAGTKVTVVDEGLDKYKRMLGRILLNGKDVNLKMVLDGQAIPYIICTGQYCDKGFFQREHVAQYFAACDAAKKRGIGIFNKDHPLTEMPYEFRVRMSGRTPEKYVGDYDTHVLHKPSDYKSIDVCRRVFFIKKEDALAIGFKSKL